MKALFFNLAELRRLTLPALIALLLMPSAYAKTIISLSDGTNTIPAPVKFCGGLDLSIRIDVRDCLGILIDQSIIQVPAESTEEAMQALVKEGAEEFVARLVVENNLAMLGIDALDDIEIKDRNCSVSSISNSRIEIYCSNTYMYASSCTFESEWSCAANSTGSLYTCSGVSCGTVSTGTLH